MAARVQSLQQKDNLCSPFSVAGILRESQIGFRDDGTRRGH